MGEYFHGRPARPLPVKLPGPRPVGILNAARYPFRFHFPPHSMSMFISWSGCTIIGHLTVIRGPWVNLRYGHGLQDHVTALAKRGTNEVPLSLHSSKRNVRWNYPTNNYTSLHTKTKPFTLPNPQQYKPSRVYIPHIRDHITLTSPRHWIRKKEATTVTQVTSPQIIAYGHDRDKQLRVQISHKVNHNPLKDTQGRIDFICLDMMDETIRKVAASSKNILGRSWETVWIPYHEGVNTPYPLSISTNYRTSRQDIPEVKFLSWTYGRYLPDRGNFIKWETDRHRSARIRNINARFMFNGTEKYINSFRQMFQENLKDFHNKSQFCRSKLQSFPYPSSVGHVIYYANNILIHN